MGISFEGREHSGLCDALNTAKLARRLIEDGCVVPVTKVLNPRLVHESFRGMDVSGGGNGRVRNTVRDEECDKIEEKMKGVTL